MSLLVNKDIRQITTKEVAKLAHVSRGALYVHYDDKYDLFNEIVEEMQEGIRQAIYHSFKDKEYINFNHIDLQVHPILSYVSEHKHFFKTMMDRSKEPFVNFHQFFTQVYNEDGILAPAKVNLSPAQRDLYGHYRALYNYAIIWYWMQDGMTSSPEVVTQQLLQLIRQKRFYWIFGHAVDLNPYYLDTAHVDRRVIRTRQALQEAMIELTIEKKNYSAVTISDIARRSNIRRATFYDHYSDKEALLKAIIHQSCIDLIHFFTVETNLKEITVEQSEEALIRLFAYLSKHRSIVHFINADYGIPDPIPEMLNCLSEFYLRQDMTITAGKKIYAYYISGLIVGLILYRLIDGTEHDPEFLAKEFVEFLDLKKYRVVL